MGSINLDVREDGGHVSVNWGIDLCQIVAGYTPVRSALACVCRSFAEATKKSRSNLILTYGTFNQGVKDRIMFLNQQSLDVLCSWRLTGILNDIVQEQAWKHFFWDLQKGPRP